MIEVDESDWFQKQVDSLENSSLRLTLLSVIRIFDDKGGIYGYKISDQILELTEGELDASNATFYAILRRLEKNGLIVSKIQPSDQGPPRKHYYMTALGIKVHDRLLLHWDRYNYFLSKFKSQFQGELK